VIALLCADLAGTTVDDGGAVLESFAAALDDVGLHGSDRERAMAHAAASMGQSKIEVFRSIFGAEAPAEAANAAFERCYADLVERGGVAAMAGASDVFAWCRERGIKVCLTTGFAPPTRDAIIERLGWGDAADLALSPADAGRGRPAPDLVLTAVLRLAIDDVHDVAVVGDTVNDLLSGHRAGASIVAGVLTGAHTREQLASAPHTHLLTSVADLPPILR
jgi:phosphonatase-like hydrolase